MDDLHNKRVTVAGLGRFGGGIEVARWLVSQGARVLVTDKESADKLADSVRKLDGLPLEFRLGEHRAEDFRSCDLVVTSPAIPPTNEFLRAARDAGVLITTEIRLFVDRCGAPVVGVTATKGKSTTTALVGEMLKARHTVHVGGNIGGSLLSKLPIIRPDHLVVLELSSYMLEHLGNQQWSPHVGIVGMIGIDHVEWHGSPHAYVNAKRNLVRFMKPTDIAVLSEENEGSASFAHDTKAKVVRFGLKDRTPFELELKGTHNQLNAQAAFAAARELGVTWDEAQRAVRDFRGLPHRLQVVHESSGVKWVNDSIATIPEAAIVAMQAFPAGKVIQIVGGYDKKLEMRPMCEALAKNCKAILPIGTLGPKLAAMSRETSGRTAEIKECGDLPTAVAIARKLATDGDVVLLSTGCASYDQFTNFEQRGDAFATLARES
ncbi:MAG TPA: UDP-N-acetylmuramoyl-L-alanine--D-glutamate ligase [Tepidisphaeraceae bacterium]|nr:UDP-N-acetylmuramoyl-L-alanine--D-glutamate ligase [Tepidisphaeraceae bacterium]